MSISLILSSVLTLFTLIVSVYSSTVEEPKWTLNSLSKYTIDLYSKDTYFLSDPLQYITAPQRKVIYVRLKDIATKLNVTMFFFVIDRLAYDEASERNGTEYAYALSKLILKHNRAISAADVLLAIYSIEDKEVYIHKGAQVQSIITPEEDIKFNDYKDYIKSSKSNDVYKAVDMLLTDFLYTHAKSTSDKVLYVLGLFGEVFSIGGAILALLYFSTKKNKAETETEEDTVNTESKAKDQDKASKANDKDKDKEKTD